MARLVVERSTLAWHRLRANHLGERLPAGSLTTAAFAGLQDSAPRAAVVALHARVEGVAAADWEHPSLVQTWAPRGAVFVVPRDHLAVFALGIWPRDPDVARALAPLMDKARRCSQEPRVKGGEAAALGAIGAPLRAHLRGRALPRLVFALAGVQVRWDGRTTYVVPSPPLQMDAEDARRELARRFLRSLAPGDAKRFSRWAAVSASDARTTFDAIAGELIEVEWPGGGGFVLAAEADELAAAGPVAGVRFVPFGGDPVLQPGDDVVLSEPAFRREALLRWASTGLVLLDGAVVGGWGRNRGRVSIFPLRRLHPGAWDEIEREASSVPFADAVTCPGKWR